MWPFGNNASLRRACSRGRLAVLTVAIGLLALPGAAHAARSTQVSFMDDQLLLSARTQGAVDRQMKRIAALGVDRLRVSAYWADHAPAPFSQTRPAGFNAADPNARGYRWGSLDRVLSSAAANGLQIMLTITTPAPAWATRGTSDPPGLWRPRPDEFAQFAEAVARRYGNIVDHYGLGNEPNWPGWLQPQRDRKGRLYSPHLYRAIVQQTYPRLKAVDPDAFVLLGETAPYGNRGGGGRLRSISPLSFQRALACRYGRKLRRIRGGYCRGFRPVVGDGIGTHPYSLFTPPNRPSLRSPNDAGFGDLPTFIRGLDRITRTGGLRPSRGRRFGLYLTEYGYQTDPPDPFSGVPLRRHNRYLQQAAYISWANPRIRELNQFRLTDGPIRSELPGLRRFIEFQSGLRFQDFRPKPANETFPHPFWIKNVRPKAGRRIGLWGQVRRGAGHFVSIQFSRGHDGPFRTLTRIPTTVRGYFFTRARGRNGYFRYRYDDGPSGKSAVIRVRPRPRRSF